MDSEDIKKQWLLQKQQQELDTANIQQNDALHNKMDHFNPTELKTHLNSINEQKLAAFTRKVESRMEGDEELHDSMKNQITDLKKELEASKEENENENEEDQVGLISKMI